MLISISISIFAQSCPTLCDPIDYTVYGILQARILEWVAFPFSRGSSPPRDRTQVSCIAGRFFTSWAIGKPKNTGVDSLSLLQRIFWTQESNQGLLHCRHASAAAAAAKSLQSCPTLSNPMDCSPPGSSVHGTFQARVLEWVAIAFSGRHAEETPILLMPSCLNRFCYLLFEG